MGRGRRAEGRGCEVGNPTRFAIIPEGIAHHGWSGAYVRRLVMIELGCVLRERRHRQNRLAGIVNRLCGESADGAGGNGILDLSENKHAGLLSKVGVC